MGAFKDIHVFDTIDAKKLFCPMPLLMIKKRMAKMELGQVLQIDVMDTNSRKAISEWCKRVGNTYLGEKEIKGILSFFIRKG